MAFPLSFCDLLCHIDISKLFRTGPTPTRFSLVGIMLPPLLFFFSVIDLGAQLIHLSIYLLCIYH